MKSLVCLSVFAFLIFTLSAFSHQASSFQPTVPFSFSTGIPDGLIGTASHQGGNGSIEIESADDFILNSSTTINHVTFVGLLTPTTGTVAAVKIEIYRVFPLDSTNPPSGNVPTRTNSPSDVVLEERNDTNDFNFSTTNQGAFTVSNTIVDGIHTIPNQLTGGEGPTTGNEVLFNLSLGNSVVLPAGHYFFIPQVSVTGGKFLWLSAPKPIVSPGNPFTPDLQSWIRNENLAPNWLRIGTDIIGPPPTGGPARTFNGVFSLSGQSVEVPRSNDTITVIKKIINDNGGNLNISGVTLMINGGNVTNGTANIESPGNYTVSEVPIPGYTGTFSGECDSEGHVTIPNGTNFDHVENVTVEPSNNKVCIITNNDIPSNPPEAFNQFDPITKNVLVFGRDPVSNGTIGPVEPISVIPYKGHSKLLTYLISDTFGNSLTLVEQFKKQGNHINVHMISVQYNNGTVIKFGENKKQFHWKTQNGILKQLDQEMEVGHHGSDQDVKVHFDSKTNISKVIVKSPKTKTNFTGMILLRMATNNGNLVIEFP